jgi:DNA-binding HxlR family transcriptional regulator
MKFGLTYKVTYDAQRIKVEYYLTDIGLELIPLFQIMSKWGDKYEKVNKQTLENGEYVFLSEQSRAFEPKS